MRSRKTIVYLGVMFMCAAFALAGCKGSAGEETSLVSVGQADIPPDTKEEKDSSGDGNQAGGEGNPGPAAQEEGAGSAGGGADSGANAGNGSGADSGVSAGNGSGADNGASADGSGVLYVDVCGQVKNPGVYQLSGGSRVYEAIQMAGGMTKKAAKSSVNQAERLIDGQQLYIPSKAEQKAYRAENYAAAGGNGPGGNAGSDADGAGAKGAGAGSKAGGGGTADGRVNLNTASKEELMSLTGIGEVKADAILRYREEHGSFQSAEDVKKIEGIKDGVYNKIKDQITV